MNIQKIIIRVAILTVCSFLVSYITISLDGDKKSLEVFPFSLAEKYTKSNEFENTDVSVNKKIESTEIKKIQIESVRTDIAIEFGNTDTLSVNLVGYFPQEDKKNLLSVDVTGKEIIIKINEEDNSGFHFFNFINFSSNSQSGKLMVTIPLQVQNLNLSTVSGDINIKGKNYLNLIAKTVSGDLNSVDLKTKEFNFSTVSGDLNLTGAVENLGFKSVSGDLDFKSELNKINLVSKTTSGDTKISFNKLPDLSMHFSSVSGETVIDKKYVTQKPNTKLISESDDDSDDTDNIYKLGTGEGELNVKSVSGDLIIKDF